MDRVDELDEVLAKAEAGCTVRARTRGRGRLQHPKSLNRTDKSVSAPDANSARFGDPSVPHEQEKGAAFAAPEISKSHSRGVFASLTLG